ncbi:LAQU0S11e04060g1_1 [Lachancea quebecensis]|uniref:EKC/KEOPS complex subunit CGI121 n=1 Tax=Lachancea quebecensis TaxID=1654605 RepID=A0A0P1KUZ7_9SACH|nr:LAQU0S11e04060g1_1 [Lachancea quebecensis]
MFCESIPQFGTHEVYVSLFRDVKNMEELRSKVGTMPYAVIDASCICCREQLFSAVYKALIEWKYNRLRTKTLNSECILSLSPTSNIGEAFKRFGIKEGTKNIVCLAVVEKGETQTPGLFNAVDGEEIEFTDENLSSMLDLEMIKKVC